MRMPTVLGVFFGLEVFHEPLGFHKFWWDLELVDRNPQKMNIVVTFGFHMFSCVCGIWVCEI